jgi:hypothetical protein
VKEAAIAKLFGSEVYNKITDLAVKIPAGSDIRKTIRSSASTATRGLRKFMKVPRKFSAILSPMN